MRLADALALLPANLRTRVTEQDTGAFDGLPCWLVAGRASRNGYARVAVHGYEPVAHRVAWKLLHGPIPAGLILDHKCRQRRCCNPAHLEPVTVRVNTMRGEAVLFGRPALVAENVAP